MSLSLDKSIFLQEINSASSINEIERLRIHYLGKKGLISIEMKSLASLSIEEKKIKGQELNIFKSLFEKELQNKKTFIENKELTEIAERHKELDKNKNIFVMCHVGTRSQTVVKWLKSQGYEYSVNVLGGIDAWAALIDRNIRRY